MTPVDAEALQAQHKRRMGFMPYLYFSAKPHVASWARPWQRQVHARLSALECVHIDPTCFVAEDADVFAEPRRQVVLGARAAIASHAYVHGPVTLGPDVSVNPYATLDGGQKGIEVGEGTRIAQRASLFAFDHGLAPDAWVHEQPVRSRGIVIGKDVWVCAGATVTDGVRVGDHAVVAAGAVVTRDVPDWAVVGGVPARVLYDRRDRYGA